jgi:hypothetical protein
MQSGGGPGGSHIGKVSRPAFAGTQRYKGPRAYGFHHERFDRYRHRPYYRYGYRPYYKYSGGYGGSCWTRVWTPDGWRRQWVCGYGRPSYGYRYYHRPYYGYRYGQYRRPYYGHGYGRR